MSIVELFYGFTLWLGSYLLARNSRQVSVQLTGWGLLAYAFALAVQIIFGQTYLIILLAPALFWIGAAIYLLPEDNSLRPILIRAWAIASIPLAILTQLNAWFAALIVVALFLCAGMIARLAFRSQFKNAFALIAVLALFVTLSSGLLILPLNWIPFDLGMTLLGLDLIFLGVALTAWDAFDEGASIRAPLARSFVASLYYAGALALIAIVLGANSTLVLMLITFGILTQTFSNAIQSWLDRLTLPQRINDERETLRQTADALPSLSLLEPTSMDEEQFTRLTRRALSNLGDLGKLASSPLVNLPMVRGSNPLDRTHALKSLLTQMIQKLKPQSDAQFGTTDEWRYYNAVYFPYVQGLKPYNRRADDESLDDVSRAALDWFQTCVPERTLHNWQNIAAKLIAEELKRQ
ncbi:MAG: hypothetical protein HZB51_20260 [Chloroflexi bacterium]|nr:hypothetical protein [Chloroflexota bacterium]